MKLFKTAAFALAIITALSGCTASLVEPTRTEIKQNEARATQIMREAKRNIGDTGQVIGKSVEHSDKMWIPTAKVRDSEASDFADAQLKRRITVNRTFYGIKDFAERVTALTGVRVTVSPDAILAEQSGSNGIGMTGARSGTSNPLPPIPGLGATGGMAGMGQQFGQYSAPVTFTFDGTVANFLDVGSARYGVSWENSGKEYRIFRYETKSFRLVALPGDLTMTNNISNSTASTGGASGSGAGGPSSSGASGQSGGTSNSTSGVSITNMSVYTAVLDAVKSMISAEGKVSVTQATGTVTVTDTPQIIARVGKYIEDQNSSLSKQVDVNVRVLSVQLSDDDQYGINWNALYQSLSGNFGFGLTNAFATSPNASNLTLKVLGTPGSGGNANIDSWRGSQAIIAALSSQGNVSQVTSASLTTLNNQPAPLQVARQTAYVASSATTLNGTSGSQTSLTPGLVTTGFTMSLVPHLQEKGKLLLQFSIDMSSLVKLETFTSGTTSIQTPVIDTRNFLQRVAMRTGDTLVLAGFEQGTMNADLQGVGSPENAALGGGINRSKSRSVIVILIQPMVSETQ